MDKKTKQELAELADALYHEIGIYKNILASAAPSKLSYYHGKLDGIHFALNMLSGAMAELEAQA